MYTKDFIEYLQKERKMSKNTLEAYSRMYWSLWLLRDPGV